MAYAGADRFPLGADAGVTGCGAGSAGAPPTFPVDIHAMTAEGNETSPYNGRGVGDKPCDIPLRPLIAADVDGLVTAVRCMTRDFIAHARYRVTGNSVGKGKTVDGFEGVFCGRVKAGQPRFPPWNSVFKIGPGVSLLLRPFAGLFLE